MYDAVIIGAGISGLVCGCYLAKAGMHTLILEQHSKPGGYCTSFRRNSFTFDAAAHSFGGFREEGIVKKVFNELEVDKKLAITRFDPSDIIITPDYKISFKSNIKETIKDIQNAFPEESNNISVFFDFLMNPDYRFFTRIRNWSFKNLLDQYFNNEKLKSILSFPLFGNGSLPPSLMSALIGAKIFQEFLLDGGYYPKGGMEALPQALAQTFKDLGGEIRLSCPAEEIEVEDNKVRGIITKSNDFVPTKYVISNCDARQTILKLLRKEKFNKHFLDVLDKMIPSSSIFIVYLGLKKSFKELVMPGVNIWLLSNYDLDATYRLQGQLNLDSACTMMRVMPNEKALLAFVNAPFENKEYWDAKKEKLMESFIDRIEQFVLPGLSKNILYKETATPQTLYKYTLNYKGAAYGWACTPSQLGLPDFRKPSFIQGLYLTGHWTTHGMGIPGVIYVGRDTAKTILKKECSRFRFL